MSDVPLVRLLSMAVSVALEELHDELRRHGHEALRPVHGYALNAISNERNTASQIAPLLGVTKQAAAKVVQTLLDEGYITVDPAGGGDGRRKPFVLTGRGEDAVRLSVATQRRIEAQWAELVGARRMATTKASLEEAVRGATGGELPPLRLAW